MDLSWLPPTVAAIGAGVVAWRKLNEVERTFNSKMDKYIKLAEDAAHARGVLQGRADVESERRGGPCGP